MTLFFLLCTSALWGQSNDSIIWVNNGKINCEIEIKSEKAFSAGYLFQAYMDSICGKSFPITKKKSTRKPGVIFSECKDTTIINDGFEIKTIGRNILIYANNSAGYNNAVYSILEKQFGCRYYAPNALVIPKKNSIKMSNVNTRQIPSFNFRVTYNGSAFDKGFGQWHGLHNKPQKSDAKSFDDFERWGLWVHTLHTLIPVETYFKTHPEYFALRNGVRIPDQLCLSNPAVLSITISSLRKMMEQNPTAKYWSVSQMDNFNYCQCDHCKAIDNLNESPSASLITFVNAIAKEFPDKIISTLAYQYSRKAPKVVKPLPNVNIMLCSIECDRHKPIATDQSDGGFNHDLQEWGQISHNILVWDYVINFSSILGPFPNFHVLKPNLDLFKENHVGMLFEQGWPRSSGELNELRTYLIAKLMWDPSANTDSLMRDFCNGFYGPGGRFVYEYIQLSTQNLLQSKIPLTLYQPMSAHAQGFLSPKNIDLYFNLFNQALFETKNDTLYQHRLQMAMQPLRYAWLEVAKSLPFTEDWIFVKNEKVEYAVSPKAVQLLQELCDLANQYGPIRFHETKTKPKEYFDQMNDYFKKGYQQHKAIGKRIAFATTYAPSYAANGENSLIDGVCGTDNYFCLWQGWNSEDVVATIDLGKMEPIHSVSLNTLCDHMSWIFPPDSIIITGSTDGLTYKEIGTISFPEARSKSTSGIIPFELMPANTQDFRFVKVHLKNIGKIPDWRGVDGKAWLFVDEIMVR